MALQPFELCGIRVAVVRMVRGRGAESRVLKLHRSEAWWAGIVEEQTGGRNGSYDWVLQGGVKVCGCRCWLAALFSG